MTTYLVFRLYGHLQGWGTTAVGELRPVLNHPSKSGLIGFIASALGIRRGDEDNLRALFDNLKCAVSVDSYGKKLSDYHTVQSAVLSSGTRAYTRKDEMGKASKVPTILSSREYMQDAIYSVCIWSNKEPGLIDKLENALKKPGFIPFLGRRSCPLSLPVFPLKIQSENVLEAFHIYENKEKLPEPVKIFLDSVEKRRVYSDPGHNCSEDKIESINTAQDHIISFSKRQFGTRYEEVIKY